MLTSCVLVIVYSFFTNIGRTLSKSKLAVHQQLLEDTLLTNPNQNESNQQKRHAREIAMANWEMKKFLDNISSPENSESKSH